jgi:hypothetical protein
VRTDRLLHLGCGLLALSLLLTLVAAGGPDDLLSFALLVRLSVAALVVGGGLLVSHLVAQAQAPPTIEEVARDWYDEA